jgi:hypothetical protein
MLGTYATTDGAIINPWRYCGPLAEQFRNGKKNRRIRPRSKARAFVTHSPMRGLASIAQTVGQWAHMHGARNRISHPLRPPRDARRLDTERGRLAIWTLAPHICVTEVQGHLTQAMSRLIIDYTEPLYAQVRTLYGFHNWFDMTNYDSICRVELTAWVMGHKTQTVVHIGTASRMVGMGVMVAKVALGDMLHAHGNAEAFERALAAQLNNS